MNQIKYGAMANMASVFLRIGISFLLTPYVLKCLGKETYGLYILLAGSIGYLAYFDFGVGATVCRFVAEYRARQDDKKQASFMSHCLFFYFIISLLCILATACAYLHIDRIFPTIQPNMIAEAKTMVLFLGINISFMLFGAPFQALVEAYQKYTFSKTIALLTALIQSAGTVLLLYLGYGVVALTVLLFLVNACSVISNILYSFLSLKMRLGIPVISKALYVSIFSYSSWIFLGNIADFLQYKIGDFLIGRYIGIASVTVFSFGMTIAIICMQVSNSISSVFMPRIIRQYVMTGSTDDSVKTMLKVGRIQSRIVFLYIVGVAAFGKQFFHLWLGNGFEEAYYVSFIIVLGLFLPLSQNVGAQILYAMKKHHWRVTLILFSAFINCLLGIALSRHYGIVGFAIGTANALIMNQIMMNLVWKYLFGFKIISFYKNLLSGLFIPGFSMVVLTLLMILYFEPHSWMSFSLMVAGFFSLYGFFLWKFDFNSQEKSQIQKLFSFKKA